MTKNKVFQDLGGREYLVEFSSVSDAEALVEEGFDVSELHVSCHPPHAQVYDRISRIRKSERCYPNMGRLKEMLSG